MRRKRRKESRNGFIVKAKLQYLMRLRSKMNSGSRQLNGTNLIHFNIFPLVYVFVFECVRIVDAVD